MAKKKRRYAELNALKGRIREKGTSYRKLAEELRISTTALSDKINGFQAFTITEAEKIANLLDIEPCNVVKFFMPSYCKTQHYSA